MMNEKVASSMLLQIHVNIFSPEYQKSEVHSEALKGTQKISG